MAGWLTALLGALGAFVVSGAFAFVLLRRLDFTDGGPEESISDPFAELAGRVDDLDKLVRDVVTDVTLRVEATETRLVAIREEWDSWYRKARSLEARVDRKRAQLRDAEEPEDEPDEGDWGEPRTPQVAAQPNGAPESLQARVFRLRHGVKR